ncbi:MAG: TRAP transporter fused permease subunit [Deltaproteobacteria bacterium]|nr:TRAP transporter fused permease subunit [Deltaproteobacteria bacterium]
MSYSMFQEELQEDAVSPGSNKTTIKEKLLFWGGLVFALIQFIVPVYVYLIDLQLRAIHVGIGISLAFLIYPLSKVLKKEKLYLWDLLIILGVLVSNINIFLKTMDIYNEPGSASNLDLALGIFLFVMVLEAARRTMGLIIPVLLLTLLGYIFVSPYLPGIWQMRGLDWRLVVNSLYYSPLGIYGAVTGMSATFISMFIIFGAFLSVTGAGRTFIDLALALAGKYTGGPAKTCVIASALFGSISGSSVANVMVTGTYTIPLMTKSGYKPNFAGAVEAISSTGGGITPPIMSITAFMMAEFLNMSYLKIILYAIIPCILYYTGVIAGVHFLTKRQGLKGLPKDQIPRWRDILTFHKMAGFLVPLGILLLMIALGKPLMEAGFYASMAALAIYFVMNYREHGLKKLFRDMIKALSGGGLDIVRLVPILVSMSVLVNLIGLAGLAPKISSVIFDVGTHNIYISLLIASILPLVLGTALPVVPTYLLSVSILSPVLQKLGVDIVAAHLFFIYWGVLGSVTPPTCEAAVVSAGIAKGDWLKTGFYACGLGAVAFCLPYFMVLDPALIGRSTPDRVIFAAITGFIGAITMSYGIFGWKDSLINIPLRAMFLIGGMMLLFPDAMITAAGAAIAGSALVLDRVVKPRAAAPA